MSKKQLVKFILQHALNFKWSVQGLGMLRLYINENIRLHIWDSRIQVPNVTLVHTHPWDLTSEVIAGRIRDVVFTDDECADEMIFKKQNIQCGEGACLVGEPENVFLDIISDSVYEEGNQYSHHNTTPHYTSFEDGSVTLNTRDFKEDTEHAYVYIPEGEEFVNAEPRGATQEQIYGITQTSLLRWFK